MTRTFTNLKALALVLAILAGINLAMRRCARRSPATPRSSRVGCFWCVEADFRTCARGG